MPVGVIHTFEVIQVHKDDRELMPETRGTMDFRLEHLVKVSRVVETGAVVPQRELEHPLSVPRTFQRSRNVIRHHNESEDFLLAQPVFGQAIRQFDNAEDRLAAPHRHTQHRPDAGLLGHRRRPKTRIVPDVFDQQRLAAFRYPTRHTLSQREARARFFSLRSKNNLRAKRLRFLIQHQQGQAAGTKEIVGLLHHRPEHIL